MDWLMTTAVIGGCALGVVVAVAIALLIFDVNPPAADASSNDDAYPN
jgi:hypothetical protein